MEETKELITKDDICSKVYIIRGQQVMLDKDLAEIYGDRKSTRLNSSHMPKSRMPSSA